MYCPPTKHHFAAVTHEIATSATALGARHQLEMADALIYATARQHDAILWTQDVDFESLPHVKYLPKSKSN